MKILFSDNGKHLALAPLTLTRPVSELRCGILTIRESWTALLESIEYGYSTEDYLTSKFSLIESSDVIISGNIKPSAELAHLVAELEEDSKLLVNGHLVATKGKGTRETNRQLDELIVINNLWDLFEQNHLAIRLDFEWLTKGKISSNLNSTNQTIGDHEIFVEEGAKVNFAILNSTDGPIYIGKNAEIMEGSLIRGPFALGDNATIKMGAKIYTGTSIGPHCKIGGEVSNSIFYAYSNKGHDGFVGNSLIGEWCNLGADTNTSNLKNNYGLVKIFDYATKSMVQTSVTFCGVVMGDHSKTGINTMLNTATSVGVSSNIFGGGFPPKHIPSFSWGGNENSPKFLIEKAYEVGNNMMSRRNQSLSEADKSILSYLYDLA